MLTNISKQLIVVFICCIISMVLCCIYPMKKELYLGIKIFFNSKTIVSSNKVISINYKREENNIDHFIISKPNSFFILNLDGKFITDITINFKEPLKENIKFKIFSEKSDEEDSVLKNIDIDTLVEKISYKADVNESIKSLVFVVGEKVGDNFILDNIIYHENYKYYFSQLLKFNYLAQFKLKNFWILLLKIFLIVLFIVEYFVVRKIIYRRIKIKKEAKNG